MVPPVPVPPIRTCVVAIPVRPPIISGSIIARAIVVTRIVAGSIIGRTWTHGNNNSCPRFADREKSSDENYNEHKEQLSHNCIR